MTSIARLVPPPRARLFPRCSGVLGRALHLPPPVHIDSPPVFQVWGCNTAVGKTVFSAALLAASPSPSLYIKPVQSGYPPDDDAAVVSAHAPHARPVSFFKYAAPVSPHLAAHLEGATPPTDAHLLQMLSEKLAEFSQPPQSGADAASGALALVETAGGVLSPTPAGAAQADAYRPLRLPAVLLGDAGLGGISATLSAYEALVARGYDVPAIFLFAQGDDTPSSSSATATGSTPSSPPALDNHAVIARAVDAAVTTVHVAPPLPPEPVPLREYLARPAAASFFAAALAALCDGERARRAGLHEAAERAGQVFWYPFTQHSALSPRDALLFDSGHGDSVVAYEPATKAARPLLDAMGAWWTNGVGHGNARVARALGAAAARYGHVMFAEAGTPVAVKVAERLLEGVGAGWASRVFFSDDGSTAVEVALKMAFRKRAVDVGTVDVGTGLEGSTEKRPVKVVALRRSYHGDTLGAMDCSEDSDFNRLQTPWYEGRGIFFDAPTVALRKGVWTVRLPDWLHVDSACTDSGRNNEEIVFSSSAQVFDVKRTHTFYDEAVAARLDDALAEGDFDIGALLMEPVLLGAGGMEMVDPAFQRSLALACRARNIPVVYDEVFTGLWRLGVPSGASLLGVVPDVAAYGKLLTGGTVPLAVTLSSEAVLRAFDGPSKREALLHGHSYTAHPAGCAAALASLDEYARGGVEAVGRAGYWSEVRAAQLSALKCVERVAVVGTVLAVEMKSGAQGYAATGAREVVRRLREAGLFARPLGNVVYVMCCPVSGPDVREFMLDALVRVVEAVDGEDGVAASW